MVNLNYSNWSNRFIWSVVFQGGIVTSLVILLSLYVISMPYPKYLVSEILVNLSVGFIEIAALAGLVLYIVIGVIGTGLSAFFYHFFEITLEKRYHGFLNILAFLHLILINMGAAEAGLLMIYAGYMGDVAVLPKEFGGMELTVQQASEQILNSFITPVGVMILVIAIGAICGEIGYSCVYFRSKG